MTITPVSNTTNRHGPAPQEPMAIVGMGMRLPGGVNTADKFWDMLIEKRDGRVRVPEDRYNVDAFYNALGKAGTLRTQYGHFLQENIQHFDPSFFSMTRSEIAKLDPQSRMLLEVVREAFENAGETGWSDKEIGCYVGTFGDDWHNLHIQDTQDTGTYRMAGYSDFALSNRVSYEYNLKGPSLTVKTACSASMIALDMACKAITSKQCTGAIVAGSNMILSPSMTIAMCEQGVVGPDGISKTFDARADGYGRGEAINALYIKTLSEAIQDGNPIQAVIRATTSNFDGKTPGITHPSSESHAALMRAAHKAAGLSDYGLMGFVECHGTGTAIGDPIETKAVTDVFREKGIYIGTCKPNFGHSDRASGITGIIKSVLTLQKRTIPPNVHFETPNPKSTEPLTYLVSIRETHSSDRGYSLAQGSCRIGLVCVNSFGVGGVNSIVVLESAASFGVKPSQPTIQPTQKPLVPKNQLLVFSANHSKSLQRLVINSKKYLGGIPIDGTADTASNKPVTVNFVFSGQGSQWLGMGRELLQEYPEALQTVRALDTALQELPDRPSWSLEAELLGNNGEQDATSLLEKRKRFQRPEISQPLCTAVQILTVNLLQSWGISPSAVVGHSSGEIAAAYAASIISQREAIILAFYRGLVAEIQTCPGGMASVGLGREDVVPFLIKGVVIACENSPQNVTLSGDVQSLEEVIEDIQEKHPDAFTRRIKVDRAYHSEYIKPVAEEYQQRIQNHFTPKKARVPFYSSVNGTLISNGEDLDAFYWRRTMASPVLFYTAVQSLLKDASGSQVFVGVGPHAALQGPLRQIFAAQNVSDAQYISTLIPNMHAVQALMMCLGQLFVLGVAVDLSALTPGRVLTDLAPYPWNHDTEYWDESRQTREWRFNPFKHHDLLGSRVTEGSGLEPLWRNMLRLENVSWINDHLVSSNVVFPAAGYVAIVGEAVRQVTGSEDYTLSKVTVASAMILSEASEVEVLTSLRPVRLTTTLDSTAYEFSIMSYSGNTWTKHCFGKVRPGSEYTPRTPKYPDLPRRFSTARCYQTFQKMGICYGPRFRGLRNITTGTVERVARATVSNHSHPIESGYQVHPIAIDNCFQLLASAEAYGLPRRARPASVPTFIESLYIAPTETDLEVIAHVPQTSRGGFTGNATGKSSNGNVVFQVQGLKLTTLENGSNTESLGPPLASDLKWKPDIDFLPLASLVRSYNQGSLRGYMLPVERLALLCTIESGCRLENLSVSQPHLYKYRAWLQRETSRVAAEGHEVLQGAEALVSLTSEQRTKEIEALSKEALDSPAKAQALGITRLFDSCVDIFHERKDPLEILMKDEVLQQIYDNSAQWNFHDLFTHLSHGRPWLRVLEVGAGTGGTTATVLPHISLPGGERTYGLYHYTDISAGFFTAAKNRFSQYSNVEYSVLDIQKDPSEQGFALRSYDVVIASNVLHATPILSSTLQNIHRLLRPDGYLILDEVCSTMKTVNYIMGTLSGWWLGEEDNRQWEPYVTPDRWAEEMRAVGFIEPTVTFDDELPYQTNALLITRPQASKNQTATKGVTLLCDQSNYQLKLVDQVESDLQTNGLAVQRCTLKDTPPRGQDIISFLDVKYPFFENITEEKLRSLVAFLQGIDPDSGILWCTRASQVDCEDPRWAQSLGFARTVRSELAVDMATLELDNCDKDAANAITKVWNKFHLRETGSEPYDPEFEWVLSAGTLHIGRFHWYSMSEELSQVKSQGSRTSKRLGIGNLGFLNSLKWTSEPLPAPVRDQVVVEVRAVGMNFVDLLMAQGIVAAPSSDGYDFGTECAGIIVETGPDVNEVGVGDRVMVLAGGAHSTALLTTAQHCVPILPDLSFAEAATIPCVYTTVIHSLVHVARLQKGQTILIHSACGGTGNAAIQISRMIGATVYATVGSDEKVQYLMETYGIPRDNIFCSRNSTFLPDVLEATGERGVDVVLNSLSGELLHASWKCVAPYGCMVELGKRDFFGRGLLEMETFAPNRAFFGVDAQRIRDERPEWGHKLLEECMGYYRKGLVGPIQPVTCFSATEIQAAFRFMQKGSHMGKIVIEYHDDPDTLAETPQKPKPKLRSDVSYLLVGGLGGIGRAVATWMAEYGAKNLVFLSRSAGKTTKDVEFFQELQSLGCSSQAFSGSVSCLNDVQRAIHGATMPVAGVIQMSMVLKVRIRIGRLGEMTIEDWEAAVKPKVNGTWNLHKATKCLPLDFMVFFGSSSGIVGLRGQANYASANTFLDAFVQYRHAIGLPASVLDIGVIEDIGYVSANQKVHDLFKAASSRSLGENDLLEALHLAILSGSAEQSEERNTRACTQIGLALGTSKSAQGSSNRVLSARDRKLAVFHNLEASDTQISADSSSNRLFQFITEAKVNPPIFIQDGSAQLLAQEIGKTLHDFLLLPTDDIDTSRSIAEIGVDSLVAIELRNWCRHKLGLEMSILEITSLTSLDAFGHIAARRLYSKYSGDTSA